MNAFRPMKPHPLLLALALASSLRAAPAAWPTNAVSLDESLSLALSRNAAIAKGRHDLEEAHGLSVQQAAGMLPRLTGGGGYQRIDENKIERVAFAPGQPAVPFQNNQSWNANITVTQPVYAGGKLRSLRRASRLTTEAALANYQALVADTLLDVRVAYADILLAAEQIAVQEASTRLLERELADTRRRFDAGTVPRFNVLRAEVELANARPPLIRARNQHRTALNNLATLLGFDVPKDAGEEIPLSLSGRLAAELREIAVGAAVNAALLRRPELAALDVAARIRGEEVVQARADYYPTLGGSAAYGWQNRNFVRDLSQDLNGWTVGAQATWNIFDFGVTRGRVEAARAREAKARVDVEDTRRRIELEVRTAHSSYAEAREVLASQAKVTEQAEEALRLATARSEAGNGTQLDVLSAQTALTQARTTYSQALRDHAVARARLDRAMGEGVTLHAPGPR
jgi:outer membrane protein TolC